MGFMKELRLPPLAEGVKEATVTYWHYKEGDVVEEGDDIVEVATDKAAFNVPSNSSGVLKKIVAKEGEIVEVGGILGIIE